MITYIALAIFLIGTAWVFVKMVRLTYKMLTLAFG